MPDHGPPPFTCRACHLGGGPADLVLDLGRVPAGDAFPLPDDDPAAHPEQPLSMWCCRRCGLAQLTEDETQTSEPRGVEPQALKDQAAAAVEAIVGSGLVAAGPAAAAPRVVEFGSPHGGSWLELLAERGCPPAADGGPAEVVVDSFGLMHEPDQREALGRRLRRMSGDAVLFLQFHSLEAIVHQRQWNALRHGHFAYYSLTALTHLLGDLGLVPLRAWEFTLYGGTVLLAVTRAGSGRAGTPLGHDPDTSVADILRREAALGLTDPAAVSVLGAAADDEGRRLAGFLHRAGARGETVYAYGAASRAVALLSRAGARPAELLAVADASPAKHGRLMPGTRIPIISPDELAAARPDVVLLLLPDLLAEVAAALPTLAGRWLLPSDVDDRYRG